MLLKKLSLFLRDIHSILPTIMREIVCFLLLHNCLQMFPELYCRSITVAIRKITGFCNQKFYNNELIVLTEENHRDKPLVVYKTAKGNHARGNYNQRQIDVIVDELLPEQGSGFTTSHRAISDPDNPWVVQGLKDMLLQSEVH
jgi:hypothetical protein